MADRDRPMAMILPLAAAGILLGTSLLLPWFHFEYSSGVRRAGAGVDDDPESTGLVKEVSLYYPFRVTGNISEENRTLVQDKLQTLGTLVVAPLGTIVLLLGIEFSVSAKRWTRPLGISLASLAFLSVAAALAFTWFALPQTLSDRGVDGFFTAKRLGQDGFIRSTPWFGWIAAGLSLGGFATFVGTKYAGGPIDHSDIGAITEDVQRRQDRREARHARRKS